MKRCGKVDNFLRIKQGFYYIALHVIETCINAVLDYLIMKNIKSYSRIASSSKFIWYKIAYIWNMS